jgi:uncharacterized protein (TIGR02145 family)
MIIVTTLVIPPGGDVGPFDLYSDSDGYTVPFATNVSAAALQAGYSSTVPNDATIIRVISTGLCTNFIDLNINLITTTTTSSSSTTTSTTTAIPCNCVTFYNGLETDQEITYIDCNGDLQSEIIDSGATDSYCGCCGEAPNPAVIITEGGACILGVCPPTTTTSSSTSSSTTTTTTTCPNCTPQDVTIGSQIWTGCNLNVDTYRNGNSIPEVTDPTAWAALTTGAWCYYNNDPSTEPIYGKLYNWYAVNDARGLAPVGYHIPTDAEWTTLTTFLGGQTVAGGKMKVTGLLCHWQTPNSGATNSSGFSGLPGGYRYNNGIFYAINTYGWWWSLSTFGLSNAWSRTLGYNSIQVARNNDSKKNGFSIRLIKD